MDEDQTNRLIHAIEVFTQSFQNYVDRQFPPRGEQVDAEIWKAGESEVKQPQSPEEYKAFPEDEPGRFEKLFSKAKAT